MNLAAPAATAPLPDDHPHLFIIDGYGFLFRAYHSLPPLTNAAGTPVGAVYGFTTMLLRLLNKLSTNAHHHVVVALDAGSKNFRHTLYPAYKANRPEAPEDLKPQFPLVEDAVRALGLKVARHEGFEADDVIATYTRLARARGMKVTIVSSDKDLMQLVTDAVEMYDPMKDKRVGIKEVQEKFGVAPAQVLDVLALMGDSSDNIPGVPGIGPKTAAELIQQFGSLDGVLTRASEIPQNKRRETIISNTEQALISKKLASLDDHTPVDEALEHFTLTTLDTNRLVPFLQTHGFKTLLAKFGAAVSIPESSPVKDNSVTETKPVSVEAAILPTAEALRAWLPPLAECAALAIRYQPQEMQLAVMGKLAQIAIAQPQAGGDLFAAPTQSAGITLDALKQALAPYLTHPGVRIVVWDAKALLHGLSAHPEQREGSLDSSAKPQNDIITNLEDIQLLSYVANGTREKLEVAPEAHALLTMYPALRAQLFAQHQLTLYERIERPLTAVLYAMEHEGIRVDGQVLRGLSQDFASRMAALETQIYQHAGKEFLIGSPKQLGEILFDVLKLPGGKKSAKTGAYATGADVLEELNEHHPMPAQVLEWRMLSKLKSTYTEALQKAVNPQTGRVHTHYNMVLTNTGRLSSHDPNLQNIPIRTEDGRKIRTAFVAREGYTLIGVDYSQIELRLLAHMADIATLKQAFLEGKDIHAITASQVFAVPLSAMTPEIRRNAKTINFGIIYGQTAHGLALQLGIPRSEAAAYIEKYFAQYPGIRAYMDQKKQEAHAQGYVTTLFGRRCYLYGIHEKNAGLRQFAERAAINAPLQGTAADIMKKAMVQLYAALQQEFPQARMLLQVHDELVLEAPAAQASDVATLCKKVMESAATLSIPLTVDLSTGAHWGQVH